MLAIILQNQADNTAIKALFTRERIKALLIYNIMKSEGHMNVLKFIKPDEKMRR